MVDDSGGGEPPRGQGSGSKPASILESSGDRLRFTVELRPGETTIVSWKRLLREATSSKLNGPDPSVSGPSTEIIQPAPEAQLLPAATANEAKESEAQAGPSRLSNVIERIERMYAGNGSSDEGDVVLDDKPDDDEYDTEDSFIDDAELDDYFQVDNAKIKHDGFFVNRGELECTEHIIATTQQPKKRRRKDVEKGHGDDARNPSKHVKVGSKGKNASSSIGRNSNGQSHKVPVPSLHGEDVLFPPLANATEVALKKKTSVSKFTVNPSAPSSCEVTRLELDGMGVPTLKKHSNKLIQSGQVQENSTQRPNFKGVAVNKSSTGKQPSNKSVHDHSLQLKEKVGLVDRFDLNIPATTESFPTTKLAITKRKTGSTIKAKSSTLEKAIRDLEKIVAEARPASVEVQDADNSSQAVKRRLPSEIKQKLAKVARLAQATFGKAPNDLIDRLMRTVGHLMQLRTLKRNLRIMAKMGLSAKQEKDDLVQKTKQEVAEMAKLAHQTSNSDDFQEACPAGKDALKRKYKLDGALEDKICDLYDLYVERVEEDAGPPVQRLYEELATLWPDGVMDTEGIKRAIYRAKDRRKALGKPVKYEEKTKKRKIVAPTTEGVNQGEGSQQASHFHENLFPQSRENMPDMGIIMPKQEKGKNMEALLPKKKKKKKTGMVVETQFRLETLASDSHAEENSTNSQFQLHNHVGFEILGLPAGVGSNPP